MRSRLALITAFALLSPFAAGAESGGRVFKTTMPAPSLDQARRNVLVYLPPSYDAPAAATRRYPVVFLLHGFPGRADDWFGRGHAARTADSLIATGAIPEVIMIGPDGNRGFFGRTYYANAFDGSYRMEDFMTHDLIAWTDSAFRTVPAAAARGVIGLSDGGTAAFNLALHHPDLFGAAGAHSADFRLRRGFDMRGIVGPAAGAQRFLDAMSPLVYLRQPGARRWPVLYFDCGTDDESFPDNQELNGLLDSLHVAHTFHAFPGSHTWKYWRTHLHESLIAVTRDMRRDGGGATGDTAR